MKRYGYHRTSTREQHLDRGIKEITAYCEQNNLELEKIFTDQQTGKNFNRPRYQVLKEAMPFSFSSLTALFLKLL
jgi:DNA invertase Pin-like site-specific DNA recombinase